mmetsp:Transcript_19019/g.25062  ORF Transcript_19019/g.25062 Transcript_19019/m.25062 type:complete len:103 (-) Transcript_19019:517-825(-)
MGPCFTKASGQEPATSQDAKIVANDNIIDQKSTGAKQDAIVEATPIETFSEESIKNGEPVKPSVKKTDAPVNEEDEPDDSKSDGDRHSLMDSDCSRETEGNN